MNIAAEHTRIEVLFNSVEIELARRWAFHNVPTVFINRPPMHLRVIVRAWWEIYHESLCARTGKDRVVWGRNLAYPARALETGELVASLEGIRKLIILDDLLNYRPLTKAEEASLCLLSLLATYYANPNSNNKWMQIL